MTQPRQQVAISVVGSINMDIVNEVREHPRPGETIHGLSTSYYPGGKGANQAVAAARAGAGTAMVGAVGDDVFSGELIASLDRSGVDTASVARKAGTSGLAFITVDGSGENSIILSEGANGQLTPDDAREFSSRARIALLQNEIPWEVNAYVLREAQKGAVKVIYNPAPARPIPTEAYPCIHTLILNETEAEEIAETKVGDDPNGAEAAADVLLGRGIQAVIVTLGSGGCYYKDASGIAERREAYRVKAVDTTAAGDTFIGAYACALTEGLSVRERLSFASAAAALAVTAHGAQVSIPDRVAIEAFMNAR
ncbi:ribokinase [Cohnella suwonensis]|uniref:Ribokinase n=1 Tax=Cohnella suwonensis TaxID=696072 RepID=A0ABW0LY21_9BACL